MRSIATDINERLNHLTTVADLFDGRSIEFHHDINIHNVVVVHDGVVDNLVNHNDNDNDGTANINLVNDVNNWPRHDDH